MAQMPRQARWPSSTAERNSQCSYLVTLPSDSYRRKAFGGAVEGDAHAVEEVDDGGALFAHELDGGLVGEEVAAVDGVVEVLEDVVTLALEVLGGVDAALGADGVRALDRDDREQVYLAAEFGDLDDGGESGEAAANDDDFG